MSWRCRAGSAAAASLPELHLGGDQRNGNAAAHHRKNAEAYLQQESM